MEHTPTEEFIQKGMVLVALSKIEEDQEKHLGEVIGGTEEGIYECIQHFSDEDYIRSEMIGRRLEERFEDDE